MSAGAGAGGRAAGGWAGPVGGAEAVVDELRLDLLDLLLALQPGFVGGDPREGLRGGG